MAKVVVALSGGVDSAIAAHLLLGEGWEVVGVTFLLWNPSGTGEPPFVADARELCLRLGIEHHAVPLHERFRSEVVNPFLETYMRGETPNPCVLCNPRVKFDTLLRLADEMHADAIATGHYARVAGADAAGRHLLMAGKARGKEQSYFLYGLRQEHLALARFPLGDWNKPAVRALARRHGLPVHDKRDSQEICFIPDNDYPAFLAREVPDGIRPGPIADTAGRVVGRHEGIHRFTIGQRKGLGIASGEPRYVVRLEPETATVVIGRHADTLRRRFIVRDVNWIAADPSEGPQAATVRIRSTHRGAQAHVEPIGDGSSARVEFVEPQSAITPGQAAVFYRDEIVLGGGIIDRVLDDAE